ncbi:MAG: ComF family protein [Armatimonadota bacterium]
MSGVTKPFQKAALARDLWSGLLDLIYPPYCLVCGMVGDDYLCAKCIEEIDVIGEQYCRRCAMPCESYVCHDCREREFAFEFESACSAGVYDGVLRKAIHALKYDKHIAIADQLGDLMVRCFPHRQFSGKIDLIVPIPIHRARLLERGFNQSIELSRRMGGRMSLPVETRVLYKSRNTRHQVELPQDQRVFNLEGAFIVRNADLISGKRVLLVDDVFTTGSTLNEAAKVLRAAGALSVYAYTLAKSI